MTTVSMQSLFLNSLLIWFLNGLSNFLGYLMPMRETIKIINVITNQLHLNQNSFFGKSRTDENLSFPGNSKGSL